MSEAFTMPPPEEAIDAETMERLRQAAEEAASWEVVPRPAARSYFPEGSRRPPGAPKP